MQSTGAEANDDLFGTWAAEAVFQLLNSSWDLPAGTRLGPYIIEVRLATGGMGEVYRALDERLHRRVALKTIQPGHSGDSVWQQRFQFEARTIAALSHPNICGVYDVGQQHGTHYLVMELIEGETLSRSLKLAPLGQTAALNIAIELASALEYAHSKGVIHRDVKPSNLMLTSYGVKLLDFGIAWDGYDHADVVAAGTRRYQAPEQFTGNPGPRSDVFSFGQVLVDMLGGSAAAIPADLQTIVWRCTEVNPAHRYTSMTEVKSALETSLRSRTRRKRRLVTLGLIAGLTAAVGGAGALLERKASAPRVRSVAVLPFQDTSASHNKPYIADQVTDEVIARLRNAPKLRVLSFDSVARVRGDASMAKSIANTLGVDSIVKGSMDRNGEEVRLDVTVIDGRSGVTIAKVERSRGMTEATLLWDELAGVLAARLDTTLPLTTRLGSQHRVDPQAWNSYALGRQLSGTIFAGRYDGLRPDEASARAVDALEQSIRRDPGFAPAYAALAQCLWSRTTVGYEAPANGSPRARTAALRALSLDRSLGEAHAFLGAVRRDYDWDWEGAELVLKRAVDLDPGSAVAHREYGTFLVAMGRFQEGFRHGERASELDPGSAAMTIFLPWARIAAGDYEEAVHAYRSLLRRTPDAGPAYAQLAWVYDRLGRQEEAGEAYRRARKYFPPGADQVEDGWLIRGLARERGKKAAVELVNFWRREKERRYVDPYNLAAMHIGLDMNNDALTELEEAYRERSPSIYLINVDMAFHPLRGDPRYREIVRAMNLDAQQGIQPGGEPQVR